jgi:hypothetical protein
VRKHGVLHPSGLREGKEKSALTVEEVVREFGAELKDEALLC